MPTHPDAIDGYKIIRELGRGGMGIVFEVEKNGQRYALKILLNSSPESSLRFQREAQILASIDKDLPVVRCYNFGMSPYGPYMLMERIDGATLQERLSSGPLRYERALNLLEQLATTIAALHKLGIIHRDIKADNVFIGPSGELRLGDFGIARLVAADDDRITQSLAVLGTPYAMAPESFQSAKTIGPPADVWALAVLLYELLTKERPFQSTNTLELVKRISAADYPPASRRRPQLPPELDLFLLSCFQIEPEARPTASEFANQCRALATSPPPNRLRQTMIRASLGLLLAALLSLGTFQLYQIWRQQQARSQFTAALLRRAASLEAQTRSLLPAHFSDWLHEALAFQLDQGPKPSDELFERAWTELKSYSSDFPQNSPWPDSYPYSRLRARLLGIELRSAPNNNHELKLWEDALASSQPAKKWNSTALNALAETLSAKPGSIPNGASLASFAGAALELQSEPEFSIQKIRTAALLEFAERHRPWVSAFCERQSLSFTIQQSLQDSGLSAPTPDLMREHCRLLDARSKREGTLEAWLQANELISKAHLALPKEKLARAYANWMVHSSIDERLLWPPLTPSQHASVYHECMHRANDSRLGDRVLPWHYRACIHLLLSLPPSQGLSNQDALALIAYQDLTSSGDLVRGSKNDRSNPRGPEIFGYLSHALRAGLFLGRDYIFVELVRDETAQKALALWPLPPDQKLSEIPQALLRARRPYVFILCFGYKPQWINISEDWRRLREMFDELNLSFQSQTQQSQRLEALVNRRILEHLSENFDEATRTGHALEKLTLVANAAGFPSVSELQNWALSLSQRAQSLAIEDPRRAQRAEALFLAAAAQLPEDSSSRKSALESAALKLEALLQPLENYPKDLEQSFYFDTIYFCSKRLAELYFALDWPQKASTAALFGWRILARANVTDLDLGELQILRLKAQPDSASRAKIFSEWASWLRGVKNDKTARARLIQSFEFHTKQLFKESAD